MNGISDVDKDKFFTISNYTATRGHSMKFAKRSHSLKVRSKSFSIRVIDSWNSLPESVMMAPSLNCFKSRFTPTSLNLGATTPPQNPETSTRIRQQRLDSLFWCSSYVSLSSGNKSNRLIVQVDFEKIKYNKSR